MTITEMCAVMLAYKNGAKIESQVVYHPYDGETVYGWWTLDENPRWDWSLHNYRVAEFPQEQGDE